MNELLTLAVDAHGGVERRNKLKSLKVAASITGAIWFIKSKGDVLNVVLTADTKTERLSVDFPGQDKRFRFEPYRIVIENTDGVLIECRDNPEKSFEGQQRETPWDDIHVTYFVGEALWTYLNTPFLYACEGFVSEEISSIQAEGETWRRLFQSHDWRRGTPDEFQATGSGYIAYCGVYVVDEEKETVTHIPSVALLPNLIHEKQLRSVSLSGERLTLRAITARGENGDCVTSRLEWQRASRIPR